MLSNDISHIICNSSWDAFHGDQRFPPGENEWINLLSLVKQVKQICLELHSFKVACSLFHTALIPGEFPSARAISPLPPYSVRRKNTQSRQLATSAQGLWCCAAVLC